MTQRKIVVRLILRRVTEEITDQAEFLRLNFTDGNDEIDPELSVYVVPDNGNKILQVKAEHTAFSGVKPAVKGALDITDLYSVAMHPSQDGGCFAYRNEAHNVLLLEQDLDDAVGIVEGYYAAPIGRLWISSRSQINEYGKREYEKSNPEWQRAAQASEAVAEWVKKKPNLSINMVITKK